MMQLYVRPQVCSNAVAFLLLTACLFDGALTCFFAFGLYALLFQTAVFDAHPAHKVGQHTQAVLEYRVIGQHSVAVEPDEAVAELIVVLY